MSEAILQPLFNQQPSSDSIQSFLRGISPSSAPSPAIKSYPDIVYYNYYTVGLSLQYVPMNDYKPKMGLSISELEEQHLSLDALDFYNVPKLDPSGTKANGTSAKRAELAFSSYPATLTLHRSPVKDEDDTDDRPSQIEVTSSTTGKDFVQFFGEPVRKGGGVGPSTGSIGIWCEWVKDGILVEFGGDEAKGPQAWERGKDAVWKVITIFKPKLP